MNTKFVNRRANTEIRPYETRIHYKSDTSKTQEALFLLSLTFPLSSGVL